MLDSVVDDGHVAVEDCPDKKLVPWQNYPFSRATVETSRVNSVWDIATQNWGGSNVSPMTVNRHVHNVAADLSFMVIDGRMWDSGIDCLSDRVRCLNVIQATVSNGIVIILAIT